MQFVENGPDIPERLLQEHEDGKVVFFCGAGISYPAGLPGFGGLVDQIYSELGTVRDSIEEDAFKRNQYDATLDLLERRVPGQRHAVRTALAKVLKPKLRKKGATDTHSALLQLAKDSNNNLRLVTTNFDRIFQHLINRAKLTVPIFPAPLLPIPKNSRWNGIVYLHGLLPQILDENSLNRLVLSSGDFGLAYLTERWAARFVSELFRNYIVCFVGYSINDPVLRYMMDALAADRMLGEHTPQAYAFGDFCPGQESIKQIEWQAKGVTPILYKVPSGTHDHSMLHETIQKWANTHRDGILGKENIVAQYAVNLPMSSTREDNFVGRTLWAISHKSSLPAKRFAELNPVPPIEWLEPLTEKLFGHVDLSRFGVTPMNVQDKKLTFSIVWRPTPYTLSEKMSLVNSGFILSDWDDVMFQIARWLLRHLNDPKLIHWIVKQGGALHPKFAWLISREIEKIDRSNQDELDRLFANSPNAQPSPLMRTLWQLVLSGRINSSRNISNVYSWLERFKVIGLTHLMRLELRDILAPHVELSEPFRWNSETEVNTNLERMSDIVRWEIVLSIPHPHSALGDRKNNLQWNNALPDLLHDFSTLLKDVMDLKSELGSANALSDISYIDQPSISEHSQNKDFHDWTILVELTRDAWLAAAKVNPENALLNAKNLWKTPYPIFKRLALFAASQESIIPSSVILEWLYSERAWWLWSEEVRRELMRLLVVIGSRLSVKELISLEQKILLGPPREMFKDELNSEQWEYIVDHGIWIRLAKIQVYATLKTHAARKIFNRLANQNPQWKLSKDEQEEFPMWMGSSSLDDRESGVQPLSVPRRRRELVEWLKQKPKSDYRLSDGWRQRCTDDFAATACSLYALSLENQWPEERWRDALQAWSEGKLLNLSWRHIACLIIKAPDEFILACNHSISWWLQSVANVFNNNNVLFFTLIERLLIVHKEEEFSAKDPVGRAINHPIGHVTEALLRWWYRQSPQDGQGLPERVNSIFTAICDVTVVKFRHGRVLLAANAISLYRVDNDWAELNLLSLFDWDKSELEARSAWEGFLWSPRLYLPLLAAIKKPLLHTASRYSELGDHARQYADFLTFIALEQVGIFTNQELEQANAALPPEGLNNAAGALARALASSGEKNSEYWRNRVVPYLKFIWPKSRNLISTAISESFARLCISSGDAFPEAIELLKNWLIPLEYPDYVIHLLSESKYSQKFPEESLDLMHRLIGDNTQWPPRDIGGCLKDIRDASPELESDARFLRLSEYFKRKN